MSSPKPHKTSINILTPLLFKYLHVHWNNDGNHLSRMRRPIQVLLGQRCNFTSVATKYAELISKGTLRLDIEQNSIVHDHLSRLENELAVYSLERRQYSQELAASASGEQKLPVHRPLHQPLQAKTNHNALQKTKSPMAPKGLYIYGPVGSGKTLLMDLFFSNCQLKNKKRVHFSAALLEINSKMHQIQEAESDKGRLSFQKKAALARMAFKKLMRRKLSRTMEEHDAALREANAGILQKAMLSWLPETSPGAPALLCLDEFQVNDVYNAAALKALIGSLQQRGHILVVSSNKAPSELHRHGLHENMFDHFIDSVHKACDIVPLKTQDYRKFLYQTSKKTEECYYLGEGANARVQQLWKEETSLGDNLEPMTIPVMFGRTLKVSRHCGKKAYFTFDELCNRTLGAADYIAVAHRFQKVYVEGIPTMTMNERDQARRFISLIDELYNHRTKFVCSAAGTPDELFTQGEDAILVDWEGMQFEGDHREQTRPSIEQFGGEEERFAFARAVSRLYEMQSQSYWY